MANILLVEDDKVLVKAMDSLLEKNGFEVTIAENGKIALEKIKENSPDLILLDIIMPKLDGFEFYEEIAQDPKFDSIPVIILSNLDSPENKKRAFNMGAVDYFVKSNTELSYLLEKVREHIR